MLHRTLIITLLLSLTGVAQANALYINDTLRVGVRTEPNHNLKPIGVITTGTVIYVLEQQGNYLRVRTDDGLEGWIKETYVTDQMPAMLKLSDLQEENILLQARVDKQKQIISEAETLNVAMLDEVTSLRETVSELRLELVKTQGGYNSNQTLKVVGLVVFILVLGIGGFAGGIAYYRNQAMRRLGGLRV